MSLYVDIRGAGNERIGDIKITRIHDEADEIETVRTVGAYRWHFTDGQRELSGVTSHRHSAGALPLVQAVIGEITELHPRVAVR